MHRHVQAALASNASPVLQNLRARPISARHTRMQRPETKHQAKLLYRPNYEPSGARASCPCNLGSLQPRDPRRRWLVRVLDTSFRSHIGDAVEALFCR